MGQILIRDRLLSPDSRTVSELQIAKLVQCRQFHRLRGAAGYLAKMTVSGLTMTKEGRSPVAQSFARLSPRNRPVTSVGQLHRATQLALRGAEAQVLHLQRRSRLKVNQRG